MECLEYQVDDILLTKKGIGCVEKIYHLRDCITAYQICISYVEDDKNMTKSIYVFPSEIMCKLLW